MAKITAVTPEGDRIEIMDTDVDPIGSTVQGKNDNPDLASWEIDKEPVMLVNRETGEVDDGK